jgi:hypothetical protein
MDVATNHSPAKTSGNSRWSFHGSATEEAKQSEAKPKGSGGERREGERDDAAAKERSLSRFFG